MHGWSGSVYVWFMVFNATFNNISVISWWSVLLVEETGVHGENHWPVASHWQTLSHNVVSSTLRHERGSNSLVVIGTDCFGSCTSNYHTSMTTTAIVLFMLDINSNMQIKRKVYLFLKAILWLAWKSKSRQIRYTFDKKKGNIRIKSYRLFK